jgi:exo-1,4-beta-D-glucosaminidase
MKTFRLLSIIQLVLFSVYCQAQISANGQLLLKNNWAIQSSKQITTDAKAISTVGFHTDGWYPTTVPTTVLAALVANKVYSDPYFGTNIKDIPGQISDRRGEMPQDSPFRVSWWYRTEFKIPAEFKNMHTWLRFQSINYRANIWLNGTLIADTTAIEGAYRLYNLDITKAAVPGDNNCLAIQIFPPKGMDLTITWVDWNPTTPDRGMGIWYDVSLHATGNVSIEDPHVVTKLNLPATDQASLTVSATIRNADQKELKGVLKGTIENISFSQEVTLAPGETREVIFSPESFGQLIVKNPRLWWPHTVGPQNLYDLNLTFEQGSTVSDSRKLRFGIREISAWMNDFDNHHTRVFQVNGKNIVIRGGGYVQDLMLRPSDERIDADLLYAKHMNLNCLRMEAPRGSDYLYERCDEEGILLMVGWCCCSSWERWKNWTPHTADIAELSWKDQIVHLRNHPSVFCWLYGSDNFPPENVEKRYLKVLSQYDPTRPYESSATQSPSTIQGNTGVYMGPYPKVYAYEIPSAWYSKLQFNTEAGPAGEQIPPIETLKKMMPEKELWPMSPSWDIRLHKAFYPIARSAFESRYGKPAGLEEYCVKAQVFQNEAVKAMFEAFAGNKYRSSGIIYWMYNSAWPKMYWQFYDYFFMPNGAFYGAKTACEPLHIQYCYDDKSVKVVNSYYKDFKGLNATIALYDFNMKQISSEKLDVNIKEDDSQKITSVDAPKDITPVYFLKLKLNDADGKEVSSNFYWLSSVGDEKADFSDLSKLQVADVKVSVSGLKKEGDKYKLSVTVENKGKGLAFAINPKILKLTSKDPVLPVFWQDNYFSLLPSEKKVVNVEFDKKDLSGEKPLLKVDGWNIKPFEKEIK